MMLGDLIELMTNSNSAWFCGEEYKPHTLFYIVAQEIPNELMNLCQMGFYLCIEKDLGNESRVTKWISQYSLRNAFRRVDSDAGHLLHFHCGDLVLYNGNIDPFFVAKTEIKFDGTTELTFKDKTKTIIISANDCPSVTVIESWSADVLMNIYRFNDVNMKNKNLNGHLMFSNQYIICCLLINILFVVF